MRPRPFSAAGLAKEAALSMGQAHEALPDRAMAREIYFDYLDKLN